MQLCTDTDIEELRAWLFAQKGYRKISEATGYPYDSLCKFADGRTKEPRLKNLASLIEYREQQIAA